MWFSTHCLLLGIGPGRNAPASVSPLQCYGKSGGFLNGLSLPLVGVGHGSHKIRSISSNIHGPRRAQRSVTVRNPVLLVVGVVRLPPIRASRRAMPLVWRKFVENRHM